MKYLDFKLQVLEHLSKYKVNELGCIKNGLYQNREYTHILPSGLRGLNFLLGVTPPEDITYHMYSHHLNSSQIMCINFFQPIMKDKLLINIAKEALKIEISENAYITDSYFEYSDKAFNDGTHFDFFMCLNTGEKIYFEIKYTEDGFGKVSKSKDKKSFPEKYEMKFESIYKNQLLESIHLKDMVLKKDEFYANYQLYRNISYIRGDKDHVVFLFPFENSNLLNEVEKVKSLSNVHILDWKQLVLTALDLSKDTKEYRIFEEFLKKYYL